MGDDISEEQVSHVVKPSVDANATLLVSRHKKATLVTGETIKVKTQLSPLPSAGSWPQALPRHLLPLRRRRLLWLLAAPKALAVAALERLYRGLLAT